MPRRVRVFVSGAVYHVYCRVARDEPVFSEAREAAALVGVIRGVTREHGLSVLAWCVMATHYHPWVPCITISPSLIDAGPPYCSCILALRSQPHGSRRKLRERNHGCLH